VTQHRPLKDRVILITGASSGLGEATARACARAGARLALAARREERLRALAAELDSVGAETLVLPTEMREPASIRAMAEATLACFGRVDALIANAGVGYSASVIEMSEEQLLEHVEVNLLGVIRSARAVLPDMRAAGRGQILAIASVAAEVALPGAVVYAATKAGVVAFCEGLRREVAADGIAVTAVLPGFIATPMTARVKFTMPLASQFGEAVVHWVRRPRARVVYPRWYAPLITLNRWAPGLVDAAIRRRQRG
jgi:short-subunit dehydrogenase